MTLLVAEQGRIFTDTAALEPGGRIGGFVAKATYLPQQHVVIASNGTTALHALAVATIGEKISRFTEAWTGVPAILKDVISRAGPAFRAQLGPDVFTGTVVVLGWSHGPKAFLVTTHDKIASLPPWKAHEIRGRFITPTDTSIDSEFGPSVELTDERAIKMAERCRRVVAPTIGGFKCVVGGALVCTTICEREITTRVLHRWPADCLGGEITEKP